MGINCSFSHRSAGEYLSLLVAVAALACIGVYYPYESALSAVDMRVVGLLVAIALLNVAYFFISCNLRIDIMGLTELASVGLTAYCLVVYLMSDITNLADLLNGVTIFSGGVGNVTTIFTIIGLMVAISVAQMIICFIPRTRAA